MNFLAFAKDWLEKKRRQEAIEGYELRVRTLFEHYPSIDWSPLLGPAPGNRVVLICSCGTWLDVVSIVLELPSQTRLIRTVIEWADQHKGCRPRTEKNP